MMTTADVTHCYQRPPSVGMPRHALRRRMPNTLFTEFKDKLVYGKPGAGNIYGFLEFDYYFNVEWITMLSQAPLLEELLFSIVNKFIDC